MGLQRQMQSHAWAGHSVSQPDANADLCRCRALILQEKLWLTRTKAKLEEANHLAEEAEHKVRGLLADVCRTACAALDRPGCSSSCNKSLVIHPCHVLAASS